jgi:hypothetical protein
MFNYNLMVVNDAARLAEMPSGTGLSVAAFNGLYTGPYNSNWMETTAVLPSASLFINVGNGNLGIITTNPESWYVNGKGIALPGLGGDFSAPAGVRSVTTTTGATDIGSVEFSTATLPPSAVASAAPAINTTTTYTFGGRTITSIAWGAAGTVPSAVDVKYYTGTNAPGVGTSLHFNAYYDINATGGSGYSYTIDLSYDTSMLGTVTNSASARMAKNTAGWITLPGSSASATTGILSSNTSLNTMSFFIGVDVTTPLAVKLVSITGVNKGNRNRIDWLTESEQAGDNFILQRGTDGRNFTDIATVAARGNGSSYSYWDEQPSIGVNYYRLKLSSPGLPDLYSRTIDLFVNSTAVPTISVAPNPAKDFIRVQATGAIESNALIQVFDLTGRMMKTTSVTSAETNLEINELPSGVYILKYVSGSHVQSFKFTKD